MQGRRCSATLIQAHQDSTPNQPLNPKPKPVQPQPWLHSLGCRMDSCHNKSLLTYMHAIDIFRAQRDAPASSTHSVSGCQRLNLRICASAWFGALRLAGNTRAAPPLRNDGPDRSFCSIPALLLRVQQNPCAHLQVGHLSLQRFCLQDELQACILGEVAL